jgi:hypothetical protein
MAGRSRASSSPTVQPLPIDSLLASMSLAATSKSATPVGNRNRLAPSSAVVLPSRCGVNWESRFPLRYRCRARLLAARGYLRQRRGGREPLVRYALRPPKGSNSVLSGNHIQGDVVNTGQNTTCQGNLGFQDLNRDFMVEAAGVGPPIGCG